MERTINFSGVTGYDLSVNGANLTLNLFQDDILTSIKIFAKQVTDSTASIISTIPTQVPNEKPNHSLPLKKPKVTLKKIVTPVLPSSIAIAEKPVRLKTRANLNADQVREIRENWEQTVKACGTKTAAADQLSKVYNCSAKNIYAIIYRHSWPNA